MKRVIFSLLAFSAAAFFVASSEAVSQPPDGGKGKKGGKQKGPPPRFVLGKVLPPFAHDELNLTAEQEKLLADLEKEVKAKLEKILTAEQKKKLDELRPPGPPPGGPGGGPPPDRPPPDGPPGPPPADGEQASTGGIQWFATLDRGLAEAERTGKPILFVSAAPHCGGVSGIW